MLFLHHHATSFRIKPFLYYVNPVQCSLASGVHIVDAETQSLRTYSLSCCSGSCSAPTCTDAYGVTWQTNRPSCSSLRVGAIFSCLSPECMHACRVSWQASRPNCSIRWLSMISSCGARRTWSGSSSLCLLRFVPALGLVLYVRTTKQQ